MLATSKPIASSGHTSRRAKMEHILQQSLKVILEKWSLEKLAPHLPFDERGDELEVVHSDTAAFIRDAVKEELDLMLENRNVLAKLDALDDLLANNSRLIDSASELIPEKDLHAWIKPEDLMRGRVMVLKRVKKAQLLREAELMDTENQAETVEFRDIATTTASLKSQVIAHVTTETS
ncbi:hypothetical protein BJ741DRAFT_56976 [Chytriomyces cf. hyalinus JEL632]|nr:hypothetical protein BJ741DRAFT_56976 [Chytriomyces cf. hyalinus JEL632]